MIPEFSMQITHVYMLDWNRTLPSSVETNKTSHSIKHVLDYQVYCDMHSKKHIRKKLF